jgi:hypothetical protein
MEKNSDFGECVIELKQDHFHRFRIGCQALERDDDRCVSTGTPESGGRSRGGARYRDPDNQRKECFKNAAE